LGAEELEKNRILKASKELLESLPPMVVVPPAEVIAEVRTGYQEGRRRLRVGSRGCEREAR
jgi:hypothetical protein